MGALHVVLAPNAFKGSLTPTEAADAMHRAVLEWRPDTQCRLVPIADGGDGSVAAFAASGYASEPVDARDAQGTWHAAEMAWLSDHAVVEIANTCGLALLQGATDPMGASTLGLGDAVHAAVAQGCRRVTVCLGGSASTDGGAGMLVALGARLMDRDGRELAPSGATLGQVEHLDLSRLHQTTHGITIDVIADVTSPLHGPAGAAHIFGPQKGASDAEIAQLDDGLRRWAQVLGDATGQEVADVPGAGAAGGTGAALAAVFGARIEPPRAILDLIGLPGSLRGADLVLTGEGCLDRSTLAGKGCAAVIDMAHDAGIATIAVCGAIDLEDAELDTLALAAAAVSADPGPTAAVSLTATTGRALRESGL